MGIQSTDASRGQAARRAARGPGTSHSAGFAPGLPCRARARRRLEVLRWGGVGSGRRGPGSPAGVEGSPPREAERPSGGVGPRLRAALRRMRCVCGRGREALKGLKLKGASFRVTVMRNYGLCKLGKEEREYLGERKCGSINVLQLLGGSHGYWS